MWQISTERLLVRKARKKKKKKSKIFRIAKKKENKFKVLSLLIALQNVEKCFLFYISFYKQNINIVKSKMQFMISLEKILIFTRLKNKIENNST